MLFNTLNNVFGVAIRRRTCRFLPLCLNNVFFNTKRNYQSLCKHALLKGNSKNLPFVLHTSIRMGGTFYDAPYTLSHIEERIMLLLKLYDKVNPDTVSVNSHFYEDLGLDSLDHVEVIIAVEDEFDFEIPEEHHHRLMRPKDIVRYVADRFDIYE